MAHYWKNHPPLHLMIRAYLGIKGEKAPETEKGTLADLVGMAQQNGGVIRV